MTTIEIGHVTTAQVRVFEDVNRRRFHFQAYTPGEKGGRATPTLCGQSPDLFREAAWFKVGDRRGRVHYDRACVECRRRLVA